PEYVLGEVEAIKKHDLPLIGTIRTKREGGKAKISDSSRIALYQKIAPLVEAIDVEIISGSTLKEVRSIASKNKNVLIISHHNFSRTPNERELKEIAEKAISGGADIIKIATFAQNESDVIRLFEFTSRYKNEKLVTIAMGAKGSISRLMFPLAGSLMTYTSVTPSGGQVPLAELIQGLRLYYPRFNEEMINRLELLEYA
ncbi:MAG: type I 3-dehydroquinate dehydratase, partial [Candidatus Omnitrophica bacterium]|nr:type I 3-dehydroquinate dehydratase [Candidatus Omnitrophota bacterium]